MHEVRDELATFRLYLFIILARNIDCKSILQKTLNQFGLVASKYERKLRYKNNFQCVSLRRRVCFNTCRPYASPKYVSVWLFYRWNLVFFSPSLEFVIQRGKPKFISFPVKFPDDKSKFQFCTTARSIFKASNNFHANCTAAFVFFFLI